MKYILTRNNKPVVAKKFSTYEEARGFARKLIRQEFKGNPGKYENAVFKKTKGVGALWDEISRNPTNITAVGYRIKAV